nr:MaoC family dehydratase [Candidatus Sigynarchaeum springense]MDO8117035.1 MaoC family dehydratase [Candidatus Sigynarchaeota archaeon]
MVKTSDLKVGDKKEFAHGPITRGEIYAYGKASKDENGIHMSDEFGYKMGLGGVIAHGMLSYGTTIAEIENWLAGTGKLTAIDCEMRGMVRPGDVVYSTFTVKEISGKTVKFSWEQYAKCPLVLVSNGKEYHFEGEQRKWVPEKDMQLVKTEELKAPLKWVKTVWDPMFPGGKYQESVEEWKDGGELKFLWRLSLQGSAEIVLNE